jgi:DNA-binding NarL/FixJ family response regulator
MTRILLADDHGIVRQGLRAVLARDKSFEVIGESGDGREAVRLAEALQPDVVIIDISMPHLNGIEAAAQILRANSKTRVIVLSMHSDETYLSRALSAGVKGYLLKESAEEDLIQAVRSVANGRPFFSAAITSALLEDYLRFMQQRNLQDSYELLTEREKEVLQLLAEGNSNKEAAALLDVSPNTIETHRTNLMQKLGLHNTAEIVLYAVRKKIIQ